MIDLGMGMANLHRFLALTLFVLLMTSASVEAQSAATPSDVTPSDVTPSDVAPSDGLSSSLPEAQEARPQRTGTKRPMNASAETQRLCFLPGIGWQSVVVPTVGETEGRQFTFSRVAQSASSRRAGGEQASDQGCSGSFANSAASGVSGGSHEQPTTSFGLKAVNTGMNDGFSANSVINPANGSTYDRSALGVSSMLAGSATKSASTIASRRNIPGLSSMPTGSASILAAEPNGLKYKAYVSPIELRRMIWNAPDLATRLKLQRATERLEESKRRPSTYSSEALSTESGKFSFRSNSETSRLRVDRETRGARRSRSTEAR